MPRIDPHQLLTCLQVLLTSDGGILSKDEVQRLANLMTKFSKKLVSKCIYVLILKNTDKELLGSFMAEGGWNLIHIWLQDAHFNKNWALVKEVLELLLITPVDVERLKMNNLPKLVKSLTKRDDLAGIQLIATTLVDEWLKIVKDVTKAEAANQIQKEQQAVQESEVVTMEVDNTMNDVTDSSDKSEKKVCNLQITISNVSKMEGVESEPSVSSNEEEIIHGGKEKDSDKDKKDDKSKSSDRAKHKSSSKSSSSRDKDKSSSSSSRDKSKSSSSSKSRDKDRKDRDKYRSNGSSSSSSSSSSSKHKSSSSSKNSSSGTKEKKEKQAEKDKDTLAKVQPPTLQKIGRIPKKNDEKSKNDKKEEVRKSTFSVEVRKTNEEKPKTVKIYNSKMRSTGLLEEAKPPPPRTAGPKKPAPSISTTLSLKRSSPIRDLIPPPEKKSRLLDVPERPGAIKLIPPKPKPAVLLESDIFMDALTAATTKKEVKKRKRRPSASKETSSPPSSPISNTPTSPTSNMKSITPANFYQDTLDEQVEEKEEEMNGEVENHVTEEIPDTPAEPDEELTPTTKIDVNGLKGVLSYGKRKGPKRSIRWRPDTELVQIQYFELDETERVNVMKPFMDMARMEMTSEREALRSRKLPNEDTMDPLISWRLLMEVDLPPPQAEIGSKSLEKEIQFAREKRVLQAIYFNNRIPDSPTEPDMESYQKTNPIIIPLDDPDNPDGDNPIPPWPEPKGSPPHVPNVPQIFPTIPGPPFINIGMNGPPVGFPTNGLPQFPPGFIPPMMRPPGPEWNGMPPPNMPPPDMMNQVPPMFDNFNPNMNDNGFPPPFSPPNNMPPMFPPNNFNNNMRGRGFRRGNNNGPWVRMAGPGPNQGGWNRGGGGPNRGGRFCINVKKHGYCRNRDNCPFVHPN